MFSHFYFTPFKLVNTGMWVWKKKPIREKKETEKICFSFRDIHYRNWKFCYAARCGAGYFCGLRLNRPAPLPSQFQSKKKGRKRSLKSAEIEEKSQICQPKGNKTRFFRWYFWCHLSFSAKWRLDKTNQDSGA